MNKEYLRQNPNKDSKVSHYQSYSQLLEDNDQTNTSFNTKPDSQISPLHILYSFLNVMENTPVDSKLLIKEQLLKSFSGRNLDKSIMFMSQVETRQNYDLSKIGKRHTSYSPNKDLSIGNNMFLHNISINYLLVAI